MEKTNKYNSILIPIHITYNICISIVMQHNLNLGKKMVYKTLDLIRYYERCYYEYGINKAIVGVAIITKITIKD